LGAIAVVIVTPRQKIPLVYTRPSFPAGISVKVSYNRILDLGYSSRRRHKRQDSKTKAIENTNQRKTCKAIWGKINDTSATTRR